MGDPQETAILLQDEILRGRIAHARYQDLPLGAHPNYIRPKNGGISTWINSLYNSLNNDGVIFIFNEKIKDLDVSGGIVNKINLSSGISLNPYSIICTIPVLLLSRYFGIVGEKPEFRDLLITHIAIDKNVSHSCQYVLNFNKEGKFYRAIFHQNIPGGEASAGVVTLEHLVDDVTNVTELALEAIHECAETGLIENTTNISQCNYLHRNSVPVPTVAYNSHSAKVSQQVCSKAKNIVFTGRASGSLFLKSIIDDAVFLIDQQIKGI
jgi:protoporphyrinogen oxidase